MQKSNEGNNTALGEAGTDALSRGSWRKKPALLIALVPEAWLQTMQHSSGFGETTA